ILCHRGELDAAEALIARYVTLGDSADLAERTGYAWPASQLRLARGDYAEALRLASSAWDAHDAIGGNTEPMKEAFAVAVQAALLKGDRARAEELVGIVESAGRGDVSPLTGARTMAFRAQLAADAGDLERGDRLFRGAAT